MKVTFKVQQLWRGGDGDNWSQESNIFNNVIFVYLIRLITIIYIIKCNTGLLFVLYKKLKFAHVHLNYCIETNINYTSLMYLIRNWLSHKTNIWTLNIIMLYRISAVTLVLLYHLPIVKRKNKFSLHLNTINREVN